MAPKIKFWLKYVTWVTCMAVLVFTFEFLIFRSQIFFYVRLKTYNEHLPFIATKSLINNIFERGFRYLLLTISGLKYCVQLGFTVPWSVGKLSNKKCHSVKILWKKSRIFISNDDKTVIQWLQWYSDKTVIQW